MKSNMSKSQEIFDARKSAQNYHNRRRSRHQHLEVRDNELNSSVEEIKLRNEKEKEKEKKSKVDDDKILSGPKKRERVLWEELDID